MNRGLLIALATLLTAILGTDACFCMPEHPQVLYCQADFAIKAYIRVSQDVYLHRDGSVEVIEEDESESKHKKKPLEGGRESTDEVQPAPVIDAAASESLPPVLEPVEEPILGEPILTHRGAGRDRGAAEAAEEEGLNGEVQPPDTEEPEEHRPAAGKEIRIHSVQISSAAEAALKVNGDDEEEEEGGVVHPPLMEAAAYRAPEYTYMGPEGAMPGHSEHFGGLSQNEPLGYRDQGPPSYSFGRKEGGSRHRRGLSFPGDTSPGGNAPSAATGKGIKMTRYTVQVTRVLKGNVANGTAYVFTPPDSPLCRMSLRTKTRYLLLGRMREYGMHVNLCDYKIDLGKLRREEARHLVANAKHRFKRGCGNCTIDVCRTGDCSSQIASSKKCVWPTTSTAMSPKASQFACIRLKNNNCGWFNALNKEMRPIDLDRRLQP